MEKINHLNNQIQADALEEFNQSMRVQDAAETTGNANIDQSLKAAASGAMAQLTMLGRRLQVRRKLLADLQQEWDDQQKVK